MDDIERREHNKSQFVTMLAHLGRKEFDAFERYLTDDFVQEWPYLPLPSMPHRMQGARAVREVMERGMSDFDGYSYRVIQLYDMLDPDQLIASYSSHSHYRPRDVPYSNEYMSVLRFRDGRVCQWIEYVNPLIIKEALLDGFDKTIEERTALAQS